MMMMVRRWESNEDNDNIYDNDDDGAEEDKIS